MRGHTLPVLGTVVGAVDAGDVHAVLDHALHHGSVCGCLRGQGDHDPARVLLGLRAEQVRGVPGQQVRAVGDLERRRLRVGVGGNEPGQGADEGVEAGHDVVLGPAQGREALSGEVGLELADVVAAQLGVVDQIRCTVTVALLDRSDAGRPGALRVLQGPAQAAHGREERSEFFYVIGKHGRSYVFAGLRPQGTWGRLLGLWPPGLAPGRRQRPRLRRCSGMATSTMPRATTVRV